MVMRDRGFTQLVTTKEVEGRRSLLPALVIWELDWTETGAGVST